MKFGDHKVVPAHTCLNCGMEFDRVTQIIRDQDIAMTPREGDVSACRYCGHLAIFTHEGALRAMTEEEKAMAAAEPALVRYEKARQMVAANEKKKRH